MEPSTPPSTRHTLKEQERIRKNKKEKNKNPPTPQRGESAPKEKSLLAEFMDRYLEVFGVKYVPSGKRDGQILKGLEKELGREKLFRYIDAYFRDTEPFLVDNGHPVPLLKTKIMKYVQGEKSQKPPAPPTWTPKRKKELLEWYERGLQLNNKKLELETDPETRQIIEEERSKLEAKIKKIKEDLDGIQQ